MKRRVALLGPPASGKGTLSQTIAARLAIPATSVGALLRARRDAGTPEGRVAGLHMRRGDLVPDEIVLPVVREWLDAREGCFLLDGFPRSVRQARALDAHLSARGIPLEIVIALELDDATITERMRGRLTCPACGKSANLGFHVGAEGDPCPYCGGALARRDDDRAEVLARRLEVYRALSAPVLEHYGALGILRRVQARMSPADVADTVARLLEGED